jgi:biotin transport system substrate-specific component
MTNVAAPTNAVGASRAKSVAKVGLCIAIMAVCAWVTIPIGPVPITLQMFAIPLAIFILRPREAVCAICGYIALGAIGVPVFSSMRGGLGVLTGPTGGYLLGYIPGVILAALFLVAAHKWQAARAAKKSDAEGVTGQSAAQADPFAPQAQRPALAQRLRASVIPLLADLCAGMIFTAVSYVGGWAQYMAVAGVTPAVSFAVCVAPFILVDILKVVAASLVARSVKLAL